MREDQEFVWGTELKNDPASLNGQYARHADEVNQQGVMCFAPEPPKGEELLASAIWDRRCPYWRISSDARRNPGASDIKDLVWK